MLGVREDLCAHHQRCQCSWLYPSIHAIKNLSGFGLDLDIVAHILPVENSGLLLDALEPLRNLPLYTCIGSSGFLVNFQSFRRSEITPSKNQNFSLRLLLRDILGGYNIGATIERNESDENSYVAEGVSAIKKDCKCDANIPPFVCVVIFVSRP